MKSSFLGVLVLVPLLLLLLLLMVLSGSTSCDAARPLRRETNDQADEALWIGTSDNKMRKQHRATTLVANEEEASYFSSGIGEMEDQEELEEEKGCGSEEEECRRRMAEAHLDYIYTQHHPHH